ncbi:ABC transporter permease, partial [Sporofaciens musculi]|uniref:ABC transporter permease n=1 Tax=Sporofaciens musculi TaxID=2681861 RepID=UPI0025704129
ALAGYLMMNLSQYNLVLALVIPLLAGAVVGFINGILVEKLSIPAFIATLATQMFIRGLVQMLCNQETYKVESVPMPILALGRLTFGKILPLPLILFVIATLIAAFVLKRRFVGRSMYIVGGNLEAANMMGVSVPKTMITAHVLCGVLTCIGGMIYTSRVGVASPLAGTGYEMYAIAAVVLGGAKLTGGVGKVSGTFIGTLIMSSFSNIFSMQNVLSAVWSDVVVGSVLLSVIMVQAVVTLYGKGKKEV